MEGMRGKEREVVVQVSMPSRGRRMKTVLYAGLFFYNLKKIEFVSLLSNKDN
jgi:hypothetical protein